MTQLLTAAQMGAVERAAMEAGDETGRALMERAGQGVVDAVFAKWPGLADQPGRAVVLCGPGNNGGDGFVIARLLRDRGWEVAVFLYGDPGKLPPDARQNYDAWCGLGAVSPLTLPEPSGAEVKALEDATGSVWSRRGPDLVVDALFGTGLARPLSGLAQALGQAGIDGSAAAARTPHVVAVDVPSGLCADSGRVIGDVAVAADLTVSFHSAKPGQLLQDGPARCGDLTIALIGLETGTARNRRALAALAKGGTGDARAVVETVTRDTVLSLPLGKGAAGPGAHKYGHGHALVLSGGAGRSGAARMAARGALRIGAGLVTLGVPGAAQLEVAMQVTAVMLRRVEDAESLRALLGDARLNALCLGPGLGLERARLLLPAALGPDVAPRPTLLDADALTAFEDAPDRLFERLHEACVLTPHGGEFSRLFPDMADRLSAVAATGPAFSRVDAAREAAARAGCVMVLKGADTVIAAPDGRCVLHAASYTRAAPWLATAGAGDVLAGMLTGLMARGVAPFDAARAAVWLHVEAARCFGSGLIAEDLPEALPGVLRDLGL